MSNLTFDLCFKVMYSHHAKTALYLPYNQFSVFRIWKQVVRNHGRWILHVTIFCGFCILFTTEVVPEIFPNFNVVAHLVVPAGWGLPCRGWLFFLLCPGQTVAVSEDKYLWIENTSTFIATSSLILCCLQSSSLFSLPLQQLAIQTYCKYCIIVSMTLKFAMTICNSG